jgi:hypothetical protein
VGCGGWRIGLQAKSALAANREAQFGAAEGNTRRERNRLIWQLEQDECQLSQGAK